MNSDSVERSTFFGDTLYEAGVLPLVAERVGLWLEPGTPGPVLMAEESGKASEAMRWDGDAQAWVWGTDLDDDSDDEPASDPRIEKWLTKVGDVLDEEDGPGIDRLFEATVDIMAAVGELLSGGWRVQTAIAVDRGDLTLTATGTPPADARADAGETVAALSGAHMGTVVLRWRAQDRSGMAKSWSLDNASLGAVSLNVKDARNSIADVVEVAAPEWTLRSGPDEAVERHSDGTAMRPTTITIDVDVPDPTPAQVEKAKSKVAAWGDAEGFSDMVKPATVADVDAKLEAIGDGMAGYYLLEFDNGDCYVGQSVSIAERLASHLLDRPGITSIRLMPDREADVLASPLQHLLKNERELIHSAQRAGLPMRNKAEMTFRAGHRALDEVFAEQGVAVQQWLTDPVGVNEQSIASIPQRVLNSSEIASGQEALEVMRKRLGARFNDVIAIQRGYVQRCLPLPSATEKEWWVVSSPIKTPKHQTLSNLSAGWVEALRINVDLSGWVQVNGSELLGEDYDDESVVRFLRQYPGVGIEDAPYVDSGPFNLNVHAPNLELLAGLLDDTRVTRAAATAALGLMRARKVGGIKNSHNAVLAGLLLA